MWVLAWLMRWGWLIAMVGAAAAVLWWFARWLDRHLDARDRRRGARAAQLAAVAARADEQNRLFLSGDPRGMYGDYPPEAAVSAVERLDEADRVSSASSSEGVRLMDTPPITAVYLTCVNGPGSRKWKSR